MSKCFEISIKMEVFGDKTDNMTLVYDLNDMLREFSQSHVHSLFLKEVDLPAQPFFSQEEDE